ncbi:hypothetical protein [Nitrosarchaeum koreense]|uniref:Uncharacterized protein n=1 Tax=Nitrosarchaeum koreense MY1 TaxID=1001994 RepID=F9CU61_9ARCH|nr:hypothetical protein [Nitrosarchaeum koreense]EGP94262.1 hypothetical protein MY1_1507 [Nitrosarchaeum koreense MY1]
MESRNTYVLAILGCIIIIIAMFFSLSLDKIIIKPLIKNYAILDTYIRLDQSKSLTLLTTNILDAVPHEK